jgi:hypothetical protein
MALPEKIFVLTITSTENIDRCHDERTYDEVYLSYDLQVLSNIMVDITNKSISELEKDDEKREKLRNVLSLGRRARLQLSKSNNYNYLVFQTQLDRVWEILYKSEDDTFGVEVLKTYSITHKAVLR